jgi:hypothetical protein
MLVERRLQPEMTRRGKPVDADDLALQVGRRFDRRNLLGVEGRAEAAPSRAIDAINLPVMPSAAAKMTPLAPPTERSMAPASKACARLSELVKRIGSSR